jgi:hypothetical protein
MSVSIDEVDCHLGILSEGGSFEGPIIVRVDDGGVEVTPSGDSGLLVPEPLGGHLRNVSRSHVRNTGSDLSAANETIEIGQLLSVGQRDVSWLVELEEIIEVFVPSAEDFGLVDLDNVWGTCWAYTDM